MSVAVDVFATIIIGTMAYGAVEELGAEMATSALKAVTTVVCFVVLLAAAWT